MDRRDPIAAAVIALACLAAAGGARAEPSPAAQPTDVVVTVGMTPIFRAELDAVLKRAMDAGTVRGVVESAGTPGGGPGRRQWLEATAVEQLVDMRLLRAEIERERIVVGRLDVDARLDRVKKQWLSRGVDWARFLEQAGLDEAGLREQVEFEIALDKLIRPKLTPNAIDAGFERYRRELDGTRVRVSHIVLRPEMAFGDEGVAAAVKRAAAIRREIVQGTSTFADAARRYSAGPSRLRGGDLGWIGREAPLLDAFAKQAYALAKGDISKPFTTPFGVHIVQVTAIEPGRVMPDAVRPKLETLLAANLLREMLATLRASTPVTFAPGVAHFDPATPADGDVPRRILLGNATPSPRAP